MQRIESSGLGGLGGLCWWVEGSSSIVEYKEYTNGGTGGGCSGAQLEDAGAEHSEEVVDDGGVGGREKETGLEPRVLVKSEMKQTDTSTKTVSMRCSFKIDSNGNHAEGSTSPTDVNALISLF